MDAFVHPPKPEPGGRVAVLSPSGRSAAEFPAVFELGLRRLRDLFALEPVEYPTTRAPEASPADRARDVHEAFADPSIGAVIASIGGEDELKVLPHLDADLLRGNPKPFFGYSDNTNLHLFLWRQRVVSYYGGSVMVQLGRPGEMHPYSEEALRRSLFTHGSHELTAASETTDEERSWVDFDEHATPQLEPAEPLLWSGPETVVTGPGWGGCLEIVDFNLRAGRWLEEPDAYEGSVLFLETSEELPDATYVYRVLMGMGERGLLSRFAAVLWARPKAWSFERPHDRDGKARYVAEQQDAVLEALAEYNPAAPLVFGLDFGHTDPQTILPSGGRITVDGVTRRIEVTY